MKKTANRPLSTIGLFLTFGFFFNPFNSIFAQNPNISGKWQGTISHGTDGYTPVWNFVLTFEQNESQISGNSYLSKDDIFVRFAFEGQINGTSVKATEGSILEDNPPPNGAWCMGRKMDLNLIEENRIEGTWTSETSGCTGGQIIVERVTDYATCNIIFVSGFGTGSGGGILDPENAGVGELAKEIFIPNVTNYVFGHDQHDKILNVINHIQEPGSILVLVGHSFGGDTVIEIADELNNLGKKVDYLIQIDSVGAFDDILPPNVLKGLNIFSSSNDGVNSEHSIEGSENIGLDGTSHTDIDNDPRTKQLIIERTNLVFNGGLNPICGQ